MASSTGRRWRRSSVSARSAVSAVSALLIGTCWLGCLSVALGACVAPDSSTSPPPATTTTSATITWAPVGLPAGHSPVTLTAYQGGVLVGTRFGQSPEAPESTGAPGLVALTSSGPIALPVIADSPYGKEATWLSIEATRESGLVAVGGARGGAHSNVRWSVWRGDGSGLRQQEQVFSTFGGWGAGEQLGVILTDAGPMLLGSWESKGAGLDADIWLPVGREWIRQDPQGTPLASTSTLLVGPRAGAARGPAAVVVGSVVDLRDGVAQRPAAWVSRDGNDGWESVDMPGSRGEALNVGCGTRDCLVVGVSADRLAAWRLAGNRADAVVGLPDFTIVDGASMPPPQAIEDGWLVVVPSDQRTRAMVVTASGVVREVPPPPGKITTIRALQGTWYAVTTDPGGRTALWSAAVTLQR